MSDMKASVVVDAKVQGAEQVQQFREGMQGLDAAGTAAQGGGQRAAQGIDQVDGAAKNAGASVAKAGGELNDLHTAGAAAAQGGQQAAKGIDQAGTAAKDAGDQVEKTANIFTRMGQAWKSTVAQFAAGTLVSDAIKELVNRAGDMAREFVRANVELDGMRRALTAIYKDGALAESQIGFLRKTANEAGVSFSSLTDSFKSFTASATAANIPLQVQNDLFASVAKAGATLGLSGERVSQALLALGQMASKGVVSMEELRGQLGESLPGALSLAAKGLGLTEAELIKLVESGGLAARDLFPALAQSLKTMSGENDGAAASWERFKSAISAAFTAVGDAGGMAVLTLAIKALGAAVGLVVLPITAFSEVIFGVAKAAGVLVGAIATLSNPMEALVQIAAAAAARQTALTDAFGALVFGADAAAQAQGRVGAAAGQSSQAAAALASAWVATGVAMREAEADAAKAAANAEKNAQAAKSEGDALVALARIRGEANALADAEEQAAQRNAQALAAVAAERTKALEIAQAELTAKTNLIAGNAEEQKAREKDIKDLAEKVDKLKAEAAASQEAANAARNGALASQAAAEARRDHSHQIGELVKELEQAKAALADVERLMLEGKATDEDKKKALEQVALALARVNDAYDDSAVKMQAYVAAAQTDAQTTRTQLEAQLEVARVEEARARRLGNEYGVRQALIKQKEIEIKIMEAEIEASAAVARAKIAAVNADRAALEAKGLLTDAKRIELDATIRALEAEIKLSQARGEGVKLQKELLEKLRSGAISLDDFSRAAGGAKNALHGVGGAVQGVSSQLGNLVNDAYAAGSALDKIFSRYGQGAKDREDRYGRPQEGSDYKKSTTNDLSLVPKFDSREEAEVWWQDFMAKYQRENRGTSLGNIPGYMLSMVRGQYNSQLEALDLRANMEAAKKQAEARKMEEEEREAKRGSGAITGTPAAAPGPAQAPTPAPQSGGSSGMKTGDTFVSNITLAGKTTQVKFTDAASQSSTEQLLRDLSTGKGVY